MTQAAISNTTRVADAILALINSRPRTPTRDEIATALSTPAALQPAANSNLPLAVPVRTTGLSLVPRRRQHDRAYARGAPAGPGARPHCCCPQASNCRLSHCWSIPMTRKAKSTKPKAKRARRQPQKKAELPASWSSYGPHERWHQRAPLKTGIEFSELVLASHDNGHGPLKFIFDTIVSCMDHEQLDKFHNGVWMIRHQCLSEIARRKAHKALPRVLDAS